MIEILHQDKAMLVLNKSAGIPVLQDGWQPEAPFLHKMLEEKFNKVWVVHRLDKVTSGVMVFARSAESHRELNRQFEHREVHKEYQAIVEGVPPWDERTARHMLQTNVGRAHRTVVVRKRGKKSETRFKVRKRGHDQALVEAFPKTGRTHQIRVHLSALGFPILGDTLYAAEETEAIARPALHASSITFAHPESRKSVSYGADLPDDMLLAMNRLGI